MSNKCKNIIIEVTFYFRKLYILEAGHDIGEMLQECVFMGKTCGPE